MLKRQKGQAFILVLILLMVGALVITPALNLAWTGLKGRMAEHTDLMEYYAADGATDYSLWRLANETGFASSLTPGVAAGPYYIILNGIKAEYSVTAQAAESAPNDAPITSFTTDRYKITASVTPGTAVAGVAGVTFAYTITLKYMYPDVPTEPLTRLTVTFPRTFNYVAGSTSGFTTSAPSTPGGTFQWNFSPDVSFNYWQEKTMYFQARTTATTFRNPQENNKTHYHEVDVRTSVPRGSTGPTAPIVVGTPSGETGIPKLAVTKTVAPTTIPPGVPTLLTYTVNMTNLSSITSITVDEFEDALPSGFTYVGPSADTGFLLLDTNGPDGTWVAGGTRQDWLWKFPPGSPLIVAPGTTRTATFQATANITSSGTYANEVWVKIPGAIQDAYSWPTGGVTVPQYDIASSAGGTTLKANARLSGGGGHIIKSWQLE